MSISRAEVERVARLARLNLTEAEAEGMTRDLGSILGYMEKIAAIETAAEGTGADGPGPGAEPSGPGGKGEDPPAGTPLREDVVVPSLPVEEALRPAPDHDDACFRVPPVIERLEDA